MMEPHIILWIKLLLDKEPIKSLGLVRLLGRQNGKSQTSVCGKGPITHAYNTIFNRWLIQISGGVDVTYSLSKLDQFNLHEM